MARSKLPIRYLRLFLVEHIGPGKKVGDEKRQRYDISDFLVQHIGPGKKVRVEKRRRYDISDFFSRAHRAR